MTLLQSSVRACCPAPWACLSDAAHSALDLVGAALTFFSVQVSDRPADEDHTYRHGKVEKNISSFGEVNF